jgi:hypothetical protein
MIKRLLFAIFIICGSITAFAQYPNAPNKMRLGAQTTGDGLIFRTDSIPDWTPSSLNNAWLAIDTLTGNAYSYQGAEWRLEVAGDLRTVYPKVINKSGTNIKRGQPVMVDYNQIIQGDLIRILPADGSGTYAGILTMGIASTDIANNAEGFITWFGYVREVKQADIAETGVTLNVGDILYLSGTQLGKLTNVEPTAPKLRVTMALVVRKPNANNLTILVRPSLNMDLGELNDVDLTGLNDGQTIVWDSAGGKWIAGNAGSVIDTTVIATRAYVNSKVDSTRLVADSILVYYIGGVEVGRDTINIPPAGVTSITAGVGLTGGTITSTGTIAADTSVLATQTYVTTRGYLTTEVDGSVTNEGRLSTTLQVAPNWVDINTNTSGSNPIIVNGSASTGSLVSGTTDTNGGVISLSNDTTVLSTKWFVGSKVDSTRLVQDSILVYYIGGVELRRDTISGVGGGGGGGMTSFTLAGSAGTPQTITDGNTLTVAAGVGISTTAAATDQVTVAADTTTVLASKTFLSTRGYTTGSGTAGTIPIWSSSTALGNSALTEASGSVTAGGTGFFRLPNGTTAQRPGTPASGMTRYNTSNGALEYYGAAAWEVPLKATAATGLGTATRLFYADANGRATDTTTLTYANNTLNSTFTTTLLGRRTTIVDNIFTASCEHAQFASALLSTGAIQITIPVAAFSSAQDASVSFDVNISNYRNVNLPRYHVNVSSTTAAVSGLSAISTNQAGLNIRAVRDSASGNVIVYIGELNTVWTTSAVSSTIHIQNINFSRRVTAWTPEACTGWAVAMQTTSFVGSPLLTQVSAVVENNQDSRTASTINGQRGESFRKLTNIAGAGGNANGVIELTCVVTANMTGTFRTILSFTTTRAGNFAPLSGKISATINFSTLAWTNAKLTYENGLFSDSIYMVRLGDDGTNLKIWFGQLNQQWGANSNITITDVQIVRLDQNTSSALVYRDFTQGFSSSFETTAFDNVDVTLSPVRANTIPYAGAFGHLYSNNFTYNPTTNRLAVGDTTATRTLTVNGEVRITDLTTDNPTRIVGADADGDLNQIIVGSGLTLSNDTLRSTATGTTNLTFSGTSSPITLNSDTGTDVRFVNGNGISLTRGGDSMTVAKALPIYANLSLLAPQTLSFNSGSTTPDTIPSLFLSQLGSVFSMDGNGLKYTSSTTRYFLVSVHVSFKFAEASNIVTLQGWKTNGGTTVSLGPTSKVESLLGNEIMQCSFSGVTSLVNNDILRFGFAPAAHTGDDDLVVDTVTITITEI